jgi:hypothetical protein
MHVRYMIPNQSNNCHQKSITWLQLKFTKLNISNHKHKTVTKWSAHFVLFQLGSDPNYLTFKPVTLVPYDNNLINPHIMNKKQVRTYLTADVYKMCIFIHVVQYYSFMFQLLWLNDYHAKVREIIGEEMLRQGLHDVYRWLLSKTEPILI